MSGSDIVPALSDPIDCSGGYSLAMFAVPRGPIPSLHGSFLLLVIVCSISALPYAVKAGISAMRQVGGELESRPDGWSGLVDTDAENHCSDPEVDLFRGDAVAIYISHEELSLVILLVTPTTQLATTISLLFTDRGWYPYTNGCHIDRGRGGLHCVKPPRDGNQLERFGR